MVRSGTWRRSAASNRRASRPRGGCSQLTRPPCQVPPGIRKMHPEPLLVNVVINIDRDCLVTLRAFDGALGAVIGPVHGRARRIILGAVAGVVWEDRRNCLSRSREQ